MEWGYGGGGWLPPMGRNFREYYKVFSVAMMGGRSDSRAAELEKGGKTHMDIEWPVLFELSNQAGDATTHAGVLEFVADEGKIYVPHWMMKNLLVSEGDIVCVRNVSLAPGTFAKFEPQSVDFLDISDPRAVMEKVLRHFACLSEGDVIPLHYNDKVYELRIIETKPDKGISIIECDLNVDFAPPVGYVEPQARPPPSASPNEDASSMKSAVSKKEPKGFVPFGGSGNRLVTKESTGEKKGRRGRKSSTSTSDQPATAVVPTILKPAASFTSIQSMNSMPDDDSDEDLTFVPGKLVFTRRHPKAVAALKPGEQAPADASNEQQPPAPKFEAFKGAGRRLA